MDGQSSSLETKSLNAVYTDASGCLSLQVVDGKLWLHAQLFRKPRLSDYKRFSEVIGILEANLRHYGFDAYYTAVQTKPQERFAFIYGFIPCPEEFFLEGITFMKKEIEQ